MLFGADTYFNNLIARHIKLLNGLVLQNTWFGHIIGAGMNNHISSSENLVSNYRICDNAKLEDIMEQFWLSERIPQAMVKVFDAFQKAEQCFQKSVELRNNIFL